MQNLFKLAVFSLIITFLSACTPALPQSDKELEVAANLEKGAELAKLAEEHARVATEQRTKAEALLTEIRKLSDRIERARKECSDAVIRAEKRKRAYQARRRKQQAAEKEPKGEVVQPQYPAYSPSDAPEGWTPPKIEGNK